MPHQFSGGKRPDPSKASLIVAASGPGASPRTISPRLSAKLEQPIAVGRLVRRSRQVEKLRAASVPLLVLTAPPGYGKTTLLGQWAEEDGRAFLWVSLDAAD